MPAPPFGNFPKIHLIWYCHPSLTVITLFWDSATIEARNNHQGHNKGGGYFELNIPKDTRGKELELPSWEPVKMVYGWVGLPRIALRAGHPVDERGEDIECVAHCANNQAKDCVSDRSWEGCWTDRAHLFKEMVYEHPGKHRGEKESRIVMVHIEHPAHRPERNIVQSPS